MNINPLSFLIESELEKAEVVLDTKAIVQRLQKMIEELAKVEAEELLPMMDKLKASYSEIIADDFRSLISEKIRLAIDTLSDTKASITSQVEKLEGMLDGSEPVVADPVDALASAVDPDAVVADAFRESLRSGMKPVDAAVAVAETYRMHFNDVVAIVKEARAKVVSEEKLPDNKDSAPLNKLGKEARDDHDKVGKAVKPVEFGALKKQNVGEAKTRPFAEASLPDNRDSKPLNKMGRDGAKALAGQGKTVEPVEFGALKKQNVEEGYNAKVLLTLKNAGVDSAYFTKAGKLYVDPNHVSKARSAIKADKTLLKMPEIVSEDFQNGNNGSNQSAPAQGKQDGDVQAAAKLTQRMKSKPSIDPAQIKSEVEKMAGSVGKTAKDADALAPMVQAGLQAMGKVKEGAKRK